MNLKSYIRGMGCGFVIAGVILLIAVSVNQNKSEKKDKKTDDKVIKQESVKPEESVADTIATDNDTQEVTTEEESKQEETTAAETTTQAETTTEAQTEAPTTAPQETQPADDSVVHILIPGGTGSYAAAKILQDAGLIDNLDAFDEFMVQGGYESKLVVGEYDIKKGSDFETIAKAITRD